MKKILRFVLSLFLHFLLSVVIVFFINSFIIQPTQVQGTSMEGTINDNDKIIINKLTSTLKMQYDYEDIVVIDSRVDRTRSFMDNILVGIKNNAITYYFTEDQDDFYWIKRIIGKEGDELEFRDNCIIRNGEVLEEEYILEESYYYNEVVIVPEGHVFVIGDNREVSYDSRDIGPIPVSHIIGKYWFTIGR